jgi:hypothetical protein
MIENIAIQYFFQTQYNLWLISFGIIIVGAIASGIFHNSSVELRRVPYFFYTGLLLFIAATSQLVWLGFIPAFKGGFLWVFMLSDVIVGLTVGYAFGIIAMARSRDAYGHARMAPLVFIPVASFWLLLTSSKNKKSANRGLTIRLLTGAFGVLAGFVLIGASGGVRAYIQAETARMEARIEDDPAMQRTAIDMMLRSQGIEETLLQLASEVPSLRVDETTNLLRAVGDGTILRYVYEVSTNVGVLPLSMRTGLVQQNCTYDLLRPLIEAGAIIEHIYKRTDGSEIGVVTVTRDDCGY